VQRIKPARQEEATGYWQKGDGKTKRDLRPAFPLHPKKQPRWKKYFKNIVPEWFFDETGATPSYFVPTHID
jgi:hypothetical protein